uniref:AT-rich interaction domain 5A n=1 Tax=Canis lupus familiaris TaxID=9615 RepID=A0A8C0N332_CANLF
MAVSGAISMDPELASWALTADNYLSGARNSHSSPELSTGCWGPAPSHGSLGSGTTYLLPQQAVVPSVPSHPPTGGSSQCLLFFPQDSPEAGGEREEDQEREEEQAFLVSLYKFMKERHTPIERVPHLGFKQINLWKIYKAVEKLGAYEMVRRVSQSSACCILQPVPTTLWGPGEEEPCLGTALSSLPDRRKRQGPRACRFPSSPACCGEEGLPGPLVLCCFKQVFLSSHLFCLPHAPQAGNTARASSQAVAPGAGGLASGQGAPSSLPTAAAREAGAKLRSLPPALPSGDLERQGPHHLGGVCLPCTHVVPLQVTGRRLWKNVYDELGGSPGSTSAATCTRRHYERYGRGETSGWGTAAVGPGVGCPRGALCSSPPRALWGGWPAAGLLDDVGKGAALVASGPGRPPGGHALLLLRLVLPYVRHLKGEDDKPLPPSKPRKQYKMAKEPRGDDGTTEKPKKAKEEKRLDQMVPGKMKTDAAPDLARLPNQEAPREGPEQPGPALGPSPPFGGASGCPEAYKRLLSSFYCKGTHGIMSPLAKKKLLAQVSKAEALQCQEEGCRHGVGSPNGDPQASPAILLSESPQSPGKPAENSRHRLTPPEGLQAPGGSLREEAQVGPRLPAPIFTGCFHAYPTEVLKPVSQHPRDFFPNFKDGVLLGPPGKEEGLAVKEPQLVWGGDANRPSAFHKGSSRKGSPYPKPKACWVSPMAKAPAESPVPLSTFPSSPGLGTKRSLEEEGFAHGGKKLRAVSPFLKEVDAKECGAKSMGSGVAVSCLLGPALGPALPEAYRGTMLRCPLNFAGTPDHLKGQATLPFSPLVIPAFPAHFLATTGPSPMATGLMHFPPSSFDSALRHRLCPASSAWHVPPATTYAAPHFFHLNTKL